MDTVAFSMPPLPVFIKGAESVFSAGKRHVRRTFSVFGDGRQKITPVQLIRCTGSRYADP